MQLILSIAIVAVLLGCAFVLVRYPTEKLNGDSPVGLFAFIAILFTSGLDVGLIMLPLTEYPLYAGEGLGAGEANPYGFTNPLATSFGFWGFLIWTFYFLTTFYFCAIEPKLQFFQKPLVNAVNTVVIIGTCAFTAYLFLSNLPSYLPHLPDAAYYAIVAFVVLCAVLSSTHLRWVTILSVASIFLFAALILIMWFASSTGVPGLGSALFQLGDYFPNVHRFVLPFSDYHAFYLFWWFSWSIMIGQFVSRFVNNMEVWKLFLALLIFPSIPIAIWFSVLYIYYDQGIAIAPWLNMLMIVVGVTFVINSLDSLTRLYTENMKLTVTTMGFSKYVLLHWAAMFTLIMLYQFTPLQIEWIGLIVIAIYAATFTYVIRQGGIAGLVNAKTMVP
ncbi:MAG: BCCT family transporter [Pseudomonadales bacterium]